MSKQLIINADDYGICREVNQAIENLIKLNKLQDVSLLANGCFYQDAVGFLLSNFSGCVGVHLNIVEGMPLSNPKNIKILLDQNGQFLKLKNLFGRFIVSPLAFLRAVEIEWRHQLEKIIKDGLTITHADSHQHIHAFPPFWNILSRLCHEFRIPALRLPREQNSIRLRRISSFALVHSANIATFFYPKQKTVTNNHFLGFKRAGLYGESEMINDVQNLKDGLTELIIHPSLSDGVPYPGLQGKLEYEALLGSRVWKQIEDSKIELVTWAEIARKTNVETIV